MFVQKLFKSEDEAAGDSLPYIYIFFVWFLPFSCSLLASYHFNLDKQHLASLITITSIFIGFLMAALVPFFQLTTDFQFNSKNTLEEMKKKLKDLPDCLAEEMSDKMLARVKLYRIIFVNLSSAILFSLGLIFVDLVMLLFEPYKLKLFSHNKLYVSWGSLLEFIIFFLTSLTITSLVNIVVKTSSLVDPEFKSICDKYDEFNATLKSMGSQ